MRKFAVLWRKRHKNYGTYIAVDTKGAKARNSQKVAYNPGDVIGAGYFTLQETGEKVKLILFDAPTRRERKQIKRDESSS